MSRGWVWKCYFHFSIVLTVLSITLPFLYDGDVNMPWWDWLYVPLYLFQAVSLFGFVYARCIARRSIWQALFVVSVCYEVWSALDMAANWFSSESLVFGAVVLASSNLVQAPLWYGNFLYAFRCKELWNAKT